MQVHSIDKIHVWLEKLEAEKQALLQELEGNSGDEETARLAETKVKIGQLEALIDGAYANESSRWQAR